jgi:hypothetical protein
LLGGPAGPAGPPGRPGAPAPRGYAGKLRRNWVWTAYYLVAVWWIASGALDVVRFTLPHGGVGTLGAIFGAAGALVGLGLLLNVDLARGIVNVIAFLNIVFGLIGIVMLFFIAPLMGIWGIVAVLKAFFDIGLSGFMIFLIGETETRGPNF